MLVIGATIAFVMFLLLPGLGGLRARARWMEFRDRIKKSALYPRVVFHPGDGDGPLGPHRLIGRIEALQGDDSLWIRGDGVTVRALMSGAEIYLLPSDGSEIPDSRALLEERLPEDHPLPLPWKRITSLQEGSRVYVIGFLEIRDGMLGMYGSREVPLLVLLFDGEDIVPRAVWAGRQRNEYWNPFTPWAVLAGSMSLFLLATSTFIESQASLTARILLVSSFAPVIPFLPPGLAFFFIYLTNWRRALFLRAERDLLGLIAFLRAGDVEEEMTGWGDDLPQDTVPLIRSCRRRAFIAEAGAGLAFLAGFALNAALILMILGFVT